MVKSETKIDPLIFILFVLWVVAMGGALYDFDSHSLRFNSIQSCILPVSLVVFVIASHFKVQNVKNYVAVIGVLIIWQCLLIYKYGGYNFLIGRFYDVTFAFILIRALGLKRMFYYYEVTVAKLSYLSLIIWIPIALFPSLRQALASFSLPYNQATTIVASWGVFGISNSENLGILRNLGFAWEPGRFASLVVLALLIHLYRTRFKLFEKNFWPLFLALLSSLSTTGYMAFFICIFGWFLNVKKSLSVQKYILLIAFAVFLLFSPFMLEKMIEISNTDTFLTDEAADYYGSIDFTYIPQRSEGLFLEWLNILNSPLVGYGDNVSYSFVQDKIFPQLKIFLSNGILQIIAMLGIPLSLLFYYALFKSSMYVSRIYGIKGKYILFFLICAINISYNFFFEPFVIAIVLYCIFLSEADKRLVFNTNNTQECKNTLRR